MKNLIKLFVLATAVFGTAFAAEEEAEEVQKEVAIEGVTYEDAGETTEAAE